MARRRTLGARPVVVVADPQRHAGDCGLVALAQALGIAYETVFQACPVAGRDGLTVRQLQALATKFKVRLKRMPKVDLDEDTGILGVEFATHGHWVYLDRGRIFDPPEVWDSDAYVANGAIPDVFLIVKAGLQPGPVQGRRKG